MIYRKVTRVCIMPIIKTAFVLVALLALSLTPLGGSTLSALAEEPAKKSADPPKEDTQLDRLHRALSEGVSGTAGWVDSFFGDQRYRHEHNRSEVTLRLNTFIEQHKKVRFTGAGHFKLVMPGLGQKLHLIGGSGENAGVLAGETGSSTSSQPHIGVSDDKDMFIALRYYLYTSEPRTFSLEGGTAYFNFEDLDMFAAFRYQENIDLDPWGIRLTQKIAVYGYGHFGALTLLDFERRLGTNYLFRIENIAAYLGDKKEVRYDLRFSLYHLLDEKSALRYGLNNFFIFTQDSPWEDLTVYISYRRQVWRKWLYVELVPQVSFPRTEDRKAVPGILLRLEIMFGAPWE